MKLGTILCAPDKLRGALTAREAAAAIGEGVRRAGGAPVELPLADGGEGTRNLLTEAVGGRELRANAADPFGCPRPVPISLLVDGTAVVEVADAVGIAEVAPDARDPLRASSAGVGSLLLAALDLRPKRVVVTLGGSATVDGGLGMLREVGAVLRDHDGRELTGSGGDLAYLARIDWSGVDARLRSVPLVAAADVMSPLHGPEGAARTFAPQKGAAAGVVERLDDGLRRLASLLGAAAGVPGAGAAGGLGAALATLGAELRPGADLVMDATGFDGALADADLCLTGEGRIDRGTSAGKTPARVAARCADAGVPCVLLAGAVELQDAELEQLPAAGVLVIASGPQPLEQALARAPADLRRVAYSVCRIFGAARDSTDDDERNP